jgi:hypothetical protein
MHRKAAWFAYRYLLACLYYSLKKRLMACWKASVGWAPRMRIPCIAYRIAFSPAKIRASPGPGGRRIFYVLMDGRRVYALLQAPIEGDGAMAETTRMGLELFTQERLLMCDSHCEGGRPPVLVLRILCPS